MTPSTVTQLLILVIFVMPGVVFQVVRARLAGESPQNQDTTNKILRALAASVALVSLYLILLGPGIVKAVGLTATHRRWASDHPREAGAFIALLLLLVPAMAALLVARRWPLLAHLLSLRASRIPAATPSEPGCAVPRPQLLERLQIRAESKIGSRYDPTPTAWDWAVDHAVAFKGFVRVKTKDGEWSYFSTFPEPPGIFVEQTWQVNGQGAFLQEQDLTLGAWIPCDEATTVEFCSAIEDTQGSEHPEQLGETRE